MILNTMTKSRDGFTLTELVLVMAIFMTILIVAARSFNTVLSQAGKQLKSAETQIEGIVGLELFRADLQQAGFGLPRWPGLASLTSNQWLFPPGSTITYSECAAGTINGVDPTTLNDAPSGVPRAVLSVNDAGLNGSDYLAIKSMVSALSDTGRKWTYLNYTAPGNVPHGKRKVWGGSNDFGSTGGDRVVVIRSSYLKGINYKQLVVKGSTFFTKVPASFGLFSTAFSPQSATDNYLVYGVNSATAPSKPTMPFNRADYFLSNTGTIPTSCAPHTGVLYKAVVDHSDGGHTRLPLLDCVVNMQVVYAVASGGDNTIDLHYDASFGGTLPSFPTLDLLWNQLREIRIYILAQDGQKDPAYTYPNQVVTVGEFGQGRNVDLQATIGADWSRYHWKVYTIVVQPKNIN